MSDEQDPRDAAVIETLARLREAGRRIVADCLAAGVEPPKIDVSVRFEVEAGRQVSVARWAFTCPACGRTSWNPKDVEEGYCGACHDWTGGRAG